jgi:hypothetical protein
MSGPAKRPRTGAKTQRPGGRGRKKRKQSAIACAAIVTPPPHSAIITAAKPKRPRARPNGAAPETSRFIIVEPKRKPNSILAHLLDHDGSEAEHRRPGELIDKLFREIVRRAAEAE